MIINEDCMCLCVQDLCQLVNADQPFWLTGMTEMTRTFGLELLEAVLTSYSPIFSSVSGFCFHVPVFTSHCLVFSLTGACFPLIFLYLSLPSTFLSSSLSVTLLLFSSASSHLLLPHFFSVSYFALIFICLSLPLPLHSPPPPYTFFF